MELKLLIQENPFEMSSTKWQQIILASVCQLNGGDVSSVISPSSRRDWLNLWPTFEHPCGHGGLIMTKGFIFKSTFFYIYISISKLTKKAEYNETHRSSWLYSPRVSGICFPPWASTFDRSQQIKWTPSDFFDRLSYIYMSPGKHSCSYVTEAWNTSDIRCQEHIVLTASFDNRLSIYCDVWLSVILYLILVYGAFLTWINFHPSINKQSHARWSVE